MTFLRSTCDHEAVAHVPPPPRLLKDAAAALAAAAAAPAAARAPATGGKLPALVAADRGRTRAAIRAAGALAAPGAVEGQGIISHGAEHTGTVQLEAGRLHGATSVSGQAVAPATCSH